MRAIFVLFITATFLTASNYPTQNISVRKKHFNHSTGLAIEGYDPVSYFSNKPKEGSKNRSYTYKGITYRFSSTTNLNLFKKNPAKYEPQYGGWCAYAMGNSNEKVEVDPETYKIVKGKLYLFYNSFFNNTKTDWNKNEKNLKAKADKNWAKFLKK